MKKLFRIVACLLIALLIQSSFAYPVLNAQAASKPDTAYLKYYAATIDIIQNYRNLNILSSSLFQIYGDSTPEMLVIYRYGDDQKRDEIMVDVYTYDKTGVRCLDTHEVRGWEDCSIGVIFDKAGMGYIDEGEYNDRTIYKFVNGKITKYIFSGSGINQINGVKVSAAKVNAELKKLGKQKLIFSADRKFYIYNTDINETQNILKNTDPSIMNTLLEGYIKRIKLKDWLKNGKMPEYPIGLNMSIKKHGNLIDVFDKTKQVDNWDWESWSDETEGFQGGEAKVYMAQGISVFYTNIITGLSVHKGFTASGIIVGLTPKDMVIKSFGKPVHDYNEIGEEDELSPGGSVGSMEYVDKGIKLVLYYDSQNIINGLCMMKN